MDDDPMEEVPETTPVKQDVEQEVETCCWK